MPAAVSSTSGDTEAPAEDVSAHPARPPPARPAGHVAHLTGAGLFGGQSGFLVVV